MDDKQFETLKNEYLDQIKDFMFETGNLPPSLTLFCTKKDEDKYATLHIPIKDRFMSSDEAKDYFVEEILPDLFKNIKVSYDVHAIFWAAESWIREAKTEDFDVKNYKKYPISKEVVIMTVECRNRPSEAYIYEIGRPGKQINKKGELVDVITLSQIYGDNNAPIQVGGRFSNLFSKFDQ